MRRLDGDVRVPAKSTIHTVLDRHGLVKRGGAPRHRARGTPLSQGALPNDLWCADFKGEFKLGNGRYCYPLTVTDHASRYLLLCEALDSTREEPSITAFERLFRDRGLPLAIHWDSGLTGFGVLAGTRQKTFILERRVNGKPRRITIGKVGEITLQKARQDAEQLIGEMSGGTDPVLRKRDQTAGGMTLRQAWELYQQALRKLNRSPATLDDYQFKVDCHMSDWLDLPLAAITPQMCNERHTKIGGKNGELSPYMANGVMRTLRAIWRRTRRQHRELPEPPTANVDFYPETGRTAVIKNWPAWWDGIQQIASPVRRDFYIWLAFTGCRAGETMSMEWKNIDLEKGVVFYPITKGKPLELPLSDFLIDLLRKRRACAETIATFGADCPWVFPSVTSESGHLKEEKLTATEPKLFTQHWSPHTLRHSWITNTDQKVKISDAHQRALTNHRPRRSKNGDAHAGYIHPDLDDLRESQQLMTDYLLAQIKPKPGRGKKRGGNVLPFNKSRAA